MHVFLDFITLRRGLSPHHFSKLNFISKIFDFTVQISAHQEGTKINTERHLKNIGTILEYKAPLISMRTNFLQPSLDTNNDE